MKKYMKVALSLLLVICLLNPGNAVGIYSNPIDAELTSETKEMGHASQEDTVTHQLSNDCKILQYVDEEVFNAGNHVSRLINEEDFSSYVFLNNDGSKTAYYTDEVVKFRDVNGRICEKDLTLIPGKSGYTTTENDVKLVIPDDPSTGIRISYNGSNVLLIPQGGATIGNPHIEENSVTYVDYYGQGMSLRYTPTLYGVKEDIVLTSYTGVNSFKFVINTDGLNLYQINDRFFLAKSVDAVERIELGDIVAFDARGRFSLGTMTTETILPGERYCITVVANKEFLEDASTTYPVSIDPTLTISDNTHGPGAIEDATVYEGTPNLNTGTWQYGHIGYYDSTYGRGHVVYRLTGLLEDDEYQVAEANQISSAKFYIREASGNSAGKVYLYPIYNNSSWTETGITWNNLGAYIGTAYDSVSMASNALVNFNITELVKDWKNNERNPRAGFILDASTLNTAVESVYTSEYTTSSYRPYVVVTYVSAGTGENAGFDNAVKLNLGYSAMVSVTTTGEKKYFKFTPTISGRYILQSSNSTGDPQVWLYNSDRTNIDTGNNSQTGYGGTASKNFRLAVILTAGQSYYIAAGHSGTYTGSYSITVLKDAEITNGFYIFRNIGSHLYLDIHGPSAQKYVHQWTLDAGEQQKWLVQKQKDGYYTIRSQYGDNLYLGVASPNTGEMNVQLFSGISNSTRWNLYTANGGNYIFEPLTAYGKTMYAPNSTSGTEMQLTWLGVGGNFAIWNGGMYNYSGPTFSAFDVGNSAEDEVDIVETYLEAAGYTDIGSYRNTEGVVSAQLIKDVSRYSDIVYVNGHGLRRANIRVQDGSGETLEWFCAESSVNIEDDFERIEIGAEMKPGSTTISESSWNERTKWVILAQCNQFNTGNEGDGKYWNNMNSASIWSKTMLGDGERLHGFLGYYSGAPKGVEHTERLTAFWEYAKTMTIVDAWKEAHPSGPYVGDTCWAVMYHKANANDTTTSFTESTAVGSEPIIILERLEASTPSNSSVLGAIDMDSYPIFVDNWDETSANNVYSMVRSKLIMDENCNLQLDDNNRIVYNNYNNHTGEENLGFELSDAQAVSTAVQKLETLGLAPDEEYRVRVSYVRRYTLDPNDGQFVNPETIEYTVCFNKTYHGVDLLSDDQDGIVVSFNKYGLTELQYKWRDIQTVQDAKLSTTSIVPKEKAEKTYLSMVEEMSTDVSVNLGNENTATPVINMAYLQIGSEVKPVWVCSSNSNYGNLIFIDMNTGAQIIIP